MQQLYLLVPLAPLAAAIVVGLFGAALGRRASHWLCCLGVGVSMVASYVIFRDVLAGHGFNGDVYTWLQTGSLKLAIGFLIDPLSATMMLVVTFVSLMVHIYTIGYMADDPGYTRFFSYISLFTFSMLMLVMSNNFLQLFFGWEAVGLVSYLLIGFWYERPTAIYANLKAFIANRVGDFGFVLGIGLILAFFGTLDYATVFGAAGTFAGTTVSLWGATPWSLLTVICICLFVGAMGKSAQVPLHVWLPDSMEGPTPISALIHAATMVTAGIFMVARMSPLFELSTTALSFVTLIGATGALFLGILGMVQNDIKRVVAYSTLSQLGYMTVALGVSAYSVAIFHLMTHAFFKALLFLGAGSVIIALHHDQDLRNMGGLRRYMPITYWTMVVGSLALCGIPPVRRLLLQGRDHRGRSRLDGSRALVRVLHRRRWRLRDGLLHIPASVPGFPRQAALRGRRLRARRSQRRWSTQGKSGRRYRAARPARHSLARRRVAVRPADGGG